MADRCICETGEELHVVSDWVEIAETTISVRKENGGWAVAISHPDNYGPDSYKPISFCPLCGKELKNG